MVACAAPATTRGSTSSRGSSTWIDELHALDTEPSRSSRCCSGAPGVHAPEPRARRRTGARTASNALKELQKEYSDALRQRQDGAAHRRAAGLLPRDRAVRRRIRAASASGAARPDFDDLLFWARDLLRDAAAGARLLPPPLPGGADRRVPGHRPGPGRARAAAHQRRRPERRLARAATGARVGSRSSATRSSRSTASAAPISPSTTRFMTRALADAQSGSRPTSAPTRSCCAVLNAVFDTIFRSSSQGCSPATSRSSRRRKRRLARRPPVVVAEGDPRGRRRATCATRRRGRSPALLQRAHTRAVGDPRPPRRGPLAAVPLGGHGDPDAGPHRASSSTSRRSPAPGSRTGTRARATSSSARRSAT